MVREFWEPVQLSLSISVNSFSICYRFPIDCDFRKSELCWAAHQGNIQTVDYFHLVCSGNRRFSAYVSNCQGRISRNQSCIRGSILSFARALGEFGVTLMFAGNIPGVTQTVPTAIYMAIDSGNMTMAWLWVFSMVLLSFFLLFFIRLKERYRIGKLEISEVAVVIAVSSPHRQAAYEVNQYAIERIKEIVPIWKKEYWEDGTKWIGDQLEQHSYAEGGLDD